MTGEILDCDPVWCILEERPWLELDSNNPRAERKPRPSCGWQEMARLEIHDDIEVDTMIMIAHQIHSAKLQETTRVQPTCTECLQHLPTSLESTCHQSLKVRQRTGEFRGQHQLCHCNALPCDSNALVVANPEHMVIFEAASTLDKGKA